MSRAYTVEELDSLRSAVSEKLIWGRYRGPKFVDGTAISSRSFRPEEMSKIIEERVRTHMIAGHTSDDLISSEPE